MPPKLIIIGLDCAEPSLLFDRWREDLPNLSKLMQQGTYGTLDSCIPAITVPAWNCMMSGRDPGELGIYGFRNRIDRSYEKMAIANGSFVKVPRLWNILGDAGWKVAVLGVPGTYPPQLVNGVLVSSFLTPNTDADFTHPLGLKAAITNIFDRYLFDVPNFRSLDKKRILGDIYQLCNQTFSLAAYLLDEYQPDLLTFVEMGVDRLHHALWKHMDSRHPLHVPDSPFQNAIYDYYRHIDNCIGQLLNYCGEDTTVLVVSDHGGQPLMGGFCLNQWLYENGYLALKTPPTSPQSLENAAVDWTQTKVWGAGGYYGRIFMNVQGREPQGIIPLIDYEKERNALAERLESLTDPHGQPLGVKAFKPQQIYRRVRGIAPDLIVYFQDMAWRSVGTVGVSSLYTQENDTGPDDANHAPQGLMIFTDPKNPGRGKRLEGATLYDILPTLLNRYGVESPRGLRGKVLDI
ncbi:alkaline phosphatase family protein [Spirulina sp. CS-785/01]|uniref:alkaline phosphatase family protein n=1 Tax=Spirulina sp. CS-785/01 TaxID=3021716 RepID=UPI00232C4185|nr:alkaline phosphatase family protein [Spirulina sp. CS-785/01]MDB9313405.1 alkaline phosphatase family protein [Spirulina sp. CS-785/01]